MVEREKPGNKQELKDSIVRCWNKIPMEYIQKCIQGLQNKMQNAIDDANLKLADFDD